MAQQKGGREQAPARKVMEIYEVRDKLLMGDYISEREKKQVETWAAQIGDEQFSPKVSEVKLLADMYRRACRSPY